MRLHRHVARLAALSLVALTVSAGLTALGSPAGAATGTYSSGTAVPIGRSAQAVGGGALTIPTQGNATPYPSTSSAIDGLVGTVTDVNLTLGGFTHAFPNDVDMLLVSPSGAKAIVMSDVGGGNPGVSGINVVLDDQAATSLPATNYVSGTYRPTNNGTGDPFTPVDATGAGSTLAAFNGTDPNGAWSLYVVDDGTGDSGSLSSWSISVTTSGEPVYPATIAVSGAPRGVTDVNVTLTGLTHAFPLDVDMLLVGPGGQQATILSDAGNGTAISGVNLVLDDQATADVPSPITAGTYRPTNVGASADPFLAPAPTATGDSALSVFNGTDPNGTWSLYIADDGSGDVGVLAAWSLTIATVDLPAAPVILTPVSGSRDKDGAFTVAGNAPSGSTVTLLEAGATKGTATASAIGQWSALVSGVPNGSHSFTATSTDSFGNVSATSTPTVVIVDSIKPTVVSTAPKTKAKLASPTANIKAKVSEAVRAGTVTRSHAFITVAGSTTHLKAKVTYNATTRMIVINPKATLAAGTKYKVTITTKVLDLAGNPLDQNKTRSGLQKKTWKFTTK